jgi:hypothetical protein
MNKVKDAADKVKSSTDQMSTSAKKANDEVTKFDRSAQKTQKSLLSWAKEKYSVLLERKIRFRQYCQQSRVVLPVLEERPGA